MAQEVASLLIFFRCAQRCCWGRQAQVLAVRTHACMPVCQLALIVCLCCRLWRIIRIMHGVAEAMELNYGQEMGRLQLRVQQLETVRCW